MTRQTKRFKNGNKENTNLVFALKTYSNGLLIYNWLFYHENKYTTRLYRSMLKKKVGKKSLKQNKYYDICQRSYYVVIFCFTSLTTKLNSGNNKTHILFHMK